MSSKRRSLHRGEDEPLEKRLPKSDGYFADTEVPLYKNTNHNSIDDGYDTDDTADTVLDVDIMSPEELEHEANLKYKEYLERTDISRRNIPYDYETSDTELDDPEPYIGGKRKRKHTKKINMNRIGGKKSRQLKKIKKSKKAKRTRTKTKKYRRHTRRL